MTAFFFRKADPKVCRFSNVHVSRVASEAYGLPAPAQLRRIISTSPSIMEIPFALDLGPRAVGMSKILPFPRRGETAPKGRYLSASQVRADRTAATDSRHTTQALERCRSPDERAGIENLVTAVSCNC